MLEALRIKISFTRQFMFSNIREREREREKQREKYRIPTTPTKIEKA